MHLSFVSSEMIIIYILMEWFMLKLAHFPSNWLCKTFDLLPQASVHTFPFQKSHVLTISSTVNFFDGLFCWIGVHHTLNKGSFRHYSSMFTILCWSKWGAWLLACPTTLAFRLFSIHFFTTFCTYLSLPHLIVTHLSCC